MIQSLLKTDRINFSLSREEALVLAEALMRLIDDDEKDLIKLLQSSAEFAVLCRLSNHLQTRLPELSKEEYTALLKAARRAIIKETGRYEGIEEYEPTS